MIFLISMEGWASEHNWDLASVKGRTHIFMVALGKERISSDKDSKI